MKDEEDGLDDSLDLTQEETLDEHLDSLAEEHDRARKALARCTHCGSKNIRRSRGGGLLENLLRLFGRRAYRCRDCRDRFYGPRGLTDN
jgi:DNA-directed RNA polymerase subunit RPC12/RpoP